ncbi:hypothetical protein [Vagococcus salmoninarum]|uniref:Tandem five-TM protein n=1 Tax=Vagococcus salmoninarum TaxID=2739 RepID=A0A429ZPZ4_9ENTE|nr:hypothetical protein [Vagococcus salmoninarum]MBE9388578.1 hypothetical protein [Vagococcus salmoninarum]RST95772.1 hypothetical protein CBF35_07330 [Vagococcus salmoninarum]
MEIITKEKERYTYLYTNQEDNTVIYYEGKSQHFYRLKNQNFDKKWGGAALFIAPLNLILNNNIVGSMRINYLLACFFGLILGGVCLFLIHRSYSSNQFTKINLNIQEIEDCLINFKKIKEIKIVLLLVWIFFFIFISVMFFDKSDYTSLLCLSIVCSFLLPLMANMNFFRHSRVTRYLKKILNQMKVGKF